MFEKIENLELVSIIEGTARKHIVCTNWHGHVFVYKINGKSRYIFANDRSMVLSGGEMLFLPEGETYTVEKITPGESKYVLIYFRGNVKDPAPRLFPMTGFPDMGSLRTSLAKLWLFQTPAERYKCLSLFYSILSFAAETEKRPYSNTHQNEIIAPAVAYLEEHIFEDSFRVEELHGICGISDTYFRRIFVSRYHMTPRLYITGKRMARARDLLDSSEFTGIREVAESVGYEDALYFSRLFKKHYGYSPTEYLALPETVRAAVRHI